MNTLGRIAGLLIVSLLVAAAMYLPGYLSPSFTLAKVTEGSALADAPSQLTVTLTREGTVVLHTAGTGVFTAAGGSCSGTRTEELTCTGAIGAVIPVEVSAYSCNRLIGTTSRRLSVYGYTGSATGIPTRISWNVSGQSACS